MFRWMISTLLASVCCLCVFAKDVGLQWIVTASSASGAIYVLPDASGETLAELGLSVTVNALDDGGVPIAGYPFQDIILVDNFAGSEVSLCNAGWPAFQNTDASGTTTFEGTAFGGGQTNQGLRVSFGGVVQFGYPPLDIQVVSADLDGDLDVDLLDLSSVPNGFAYRFGNGIYDWQSDFNHDSQENLIDVARMAMAMGISCP